MATPVQTLCKGKTGSGGSSLTCVGTVGATANTAGDSLVAYVLTGSASNSCSGVTDSASNTWVRLGTQLQDATSSITVDVFWCANPAALAANTGTVTATFTGTGNAQLLMVVEYTGTCTAPDTAVIARAASSTPSAAKVTPSAATAIVAGIACCANDTAATVGTPFTVWDSQAETSGSARAITLAYKQESDTTFDGPSFTLPANIASVLFTHTMIPASTSTAHLLALTGAGS